MAIGIYTETVGKMGTNSILNGDNIDISGTMESISITIEVFVISRFILVLIQIIQSCLDPLSYLKICLFCH